MNHRFIWIQRGAILLITLGVMLRFVNLDRKVYWHDEVFTSLRVAGYFGQAVTAEVFTGKVITAPELLQYQQFPADAGLGKTWTALANNPEHPPGYYLMAYGWGRLGGASVAGYRAIAAGFGVLALPLMYWLSRELFPAQPPIAWIATAMVAVSPVHLIYSQEAREYSFWVVGLLLANITLWRAVRLNNRRAWLSYGLALALALYGALLTALLGLSHLLFIGLTQKPRQWLSFALSGGLALLLFSPWLWVVYRQWSRLQDVTNWTQDSKPLGFLARLWSLHYSAVFVDADFSLNHPFNNLVPPLILVMIGWACWHIVRYYNRTTSLFLLSLLLTTPLVMIGRDLIVSGQLSGGTRYFFPSLIAVPLVVAAWLSDLIGSKRPLQRRWGRAMVSGLLLAGLISCGINLQARTWWNKGDGYHNAALADYLNTLVQPVMISQQQDTTLGNVISLSYRLEPQAQFRLIQGPLPDLGNEDQVLLLLRPDPALIEAAAQRYRVEPVEADGVNGLFRLEPLASP